MIIGISGYATSGKDTVGQMIVEEFGYERRAFADKLRDAALALDPIVFPGSGERLGQVVARLGWAEAKKFTEIRRTLQRMGTEMGRQTLSPNVWVKAVHESMQQNMAGYVKSDYVITDVRFMNEANWVKHSQQGIMLRVNRPGVGPANGHPSEMELDGYPFDIVIDNAGTLDDLRDKVKDKLSPLGVLSTMGQ